MSFAKIEFIWKEYICTGLDKRYLSDNVSQVRECIKILGRMLLQLTADSRADTMNQEACRN